MNQIGWRNNILAWASWLTQSRFGVYIFSLLFTLAMLYQRIVPLNAIIMDRDYVI